MSQPAPDTGSAHQLVRAPDEVIDRIAQEVQPQPSPPGRMALAATAAFLFTWPLAFVVFVAATLLAPSVTDEAGVGRVALWALLFAGLTALGAAVGAARRPAAEPEADPAPWRIAVRLTRHGLFTAAYAGLVLASQGLTVGQIATLTAVLVMVLHLLPAIVAWLLSGRRRRRQVSPST